ncbi:MAG: hypothetical protein M1827_005516 [Pycnora praestabilis]|nr:MAG: hypothetical protein M1827_005516 [Pycnora praestabilis]
MGWKSSRRTAAEYNARIQRQRKAKAERYERAPKSEIMASDEIEGIDVRKAEESLWNLQIPTITEDDFHTFYVQHFSPQSITHISTASTISEFENDLAGEDDGLGYYPDGRKRTLTDEQIAIFRHSEIQALLREQRHARENKEPSEDGECDPGLAEAEAELGEVLEDSEETTVPKDDDGEQTGLVEDDEQEYEEFLRKEQAELQSSRSKKRKRKGAKATKSTESEKTERRMAREEDDFKEEAGGLDYGDDTVLEEASAKQKALNDQMHRSQGRRMVMYDDEDEENGAAPTMEPTQDIAPEAKRVFLWPKIRS